VAAYSNTLELARLGITVMRRCTITDPCRASLAGNGRVREFAVSQPNFLCPLVLILLHAHGAMFNPGSNECSDI